MRHYIDLAKYLEELMKEDKRFIIVCKREFAVIVFKMKGPEDCEFTVNESQREYYRICSEDTKEGFFSFTHLGDEELLRVVIGNPNTTKEIVGVFWQKLKRDADAFYKKFDRKLNFLGNVETIDNF